MSTQLRVQQGTGESHGLQASDLGRLQREFGAHDVNLSLKSCMMLASFIFLYCEFGVY
jgi:hypothetical protein